MRSKDEAKLERIREAVVRLSAREGLVGLSMAGIAGEAKIATGTLYVYFESKEALLEDVYREIKSRTAVMYFRDIDPAAPVKVRFRTVWMNALDHRIAHFGEAVFTEQYYQSAFMNEYGRRETHRLFAPLFELIEEGQRQMIIKELDPLLIAMFSIGPVIELAGLARLGVVELGPELREAAWAMSWDAVRA